MSLDVEYNISEPDTMSPVHIPGCVNLDSFNTHMHAYQINNRLTGLEQFVFFIELCVISHCALLLRCAPTSSSLKAARLFKPFTRASLPKKSLPCRDFHLVEDDEECRVHGANARAGELQVAHADAKHTACFG